VNIERVLSVTRNYFEIKPKTPKVSYIGIVRVKANQALLAPIGQSTNWISRTKPPGIRTRIQEKLIYWG
jgi:hypothetical protein